MPWRNGPQARATGFHIPPDRLPRSIAARLSRAGLIAPAVPTGRPDPARVAGESDRRDDPAATGPGDLNP